tara:strand:+ start:269 stop:664 length:396 start_codon:yes stop_codon:yes gene_type:complete
MKKILTLALALVLAFSVSAQAENADITADKQKVRKERMYNNGEMRTEKGERSEKVKAARRECAQTCGLNKDKVKQCRKQLGLKKGENAKGKCVSNKNKACIKSCMKKKKAQHKAKDSERKKHNPSQESDVE